MVDCFQTGTLAALYSNTNQLKISFFEILEAYPNFSDGTTYCLGIKMKSTQFTFQ